MKFIKKVAEKIANIQAWLLLTVIYFTILPIFALLLSLQKKRLKSGWLKWRIKSDTLQDLQKQG